MIQETFLPQHLCQKLVEKGMEIDRKFKYQVGHSDAVYQYKCTQAQAMRWLREEKKLFIEIKISRNTFLWGYTIIRGNSSTAIIYSRTFLSYEQAAQSAIEHCIKNLI